jgi:hypothetical protein
MIMVEPRQSNKTARLVELLKAMPPEERAHTRVFTRGSGWLTVDEYLQIQEDKR